MRTWNAGEQDLAISYLRSGLFEGNVSSTNSAIAMTSGLLNDSLKLYQAGNSEESYEKALDAYLLGFEQIEPDLFVKDRKFTAGIEASFGNYRNAIKSEKPIAEVQDLNETLQNDLVSASSILETGFL